MDSWADLFDGELHELRPGEDFRIMSRRWDREMADAEMLSCVVESGWAVTAVRLNAIARGLGGRKHCAWQKGKRYFFKLVMEDS